MKNLLSLIFFLLPFGSVFAEEIPDLMDYEGYRNNVDTFCKLEGNIPNKSDLWTDWEKHSLLKIEQIQYADITKDDGDAYYKKHLENIQSDPSMIDIIGVGMGPKFVEKASHIYKETMGAVYACAVMNTKIRIIDTLTSAIPMTQSNTKNRLKNQLSSLRKTLGKKGCREIADTSEISLKKTLLDNTTYQYCNYRHYLAYLENASRKALDIYYQINKDSGTGLGYNTGSYNLLKNTDSATMQISQSAGEIVSEIAHTKEIYPQAMVAFTEFERTYASHILLELILQDYIELRTSLKKLMNPIGQVIYKASNAQSPGK